jgi:hypothetical protein
MTLHWYPCIYIGICVHSLEYVSLRWDTWSCIGQCDKDSASSCMPPRSPLEDTLVFLEEYSHTSGFVELVVPFCPHLWGSYGGWSWLRGCFTHLNHFMGLLNWLWVDLTTHPLKRLSSYATCAIIYWSTSPLVPHVLVCWYLIVQHTHRFDYSSHIMELGD